MPIIILLIASLGSAGYVGAEAQVKYNWLHVAPVTQAVTK